MGRTRRSQSARRGGGVDGRRPHHHSGAGIRTIASEPAVRPPFLGPDRRGDGFVNVGWAILLPKPAYAALNR